MWFEIWKWRKKVHQKADSNRVDRAKVKTQNILPTAPLELTSVDRLL